MAYTFENSSLHTEKKVNRMDKYHLFLRDLEDYPLLSPLEEKRLLKDYKKGDINARDKLITSNIRLVISIAKKYENDGLEFLDLVQEGIFGLYEALEKFDIYKDIKFSTYAYWWIKQSIGLAIANKSREIRIPVYKNVLIDSYIKAFKELTFELKRYPETKEVAESMGISVSEVLELRKLSMEMVYLNKKIVVDDGKEESELIDFIESKEFISPSDYALKEERKTIFAEVYNALDDRTKQIVKLRLIDNLPLVKVGKIVGISGEMVRVICNNVIKDIKNYEKVRSISGENERNLTKTIRYKKEPFNYLKVLDIESAEEDSFLKEKDIKIMKLLLGGVSADYKGNIKKICDDFAYTPSDVIEALDNYKKVLKEYKNNTCRAKVRR